MQYPAGIIEEHINTYLYIQTKRSMWRHVKRNGKDKKYFIILGDQYFWSGKHCCTKTFGGVIKTNDLYIPHDIDS